MARKVFTLLLAASGTVWLAAQAQGLPAPATAVTAAKAKPGDVPNFAQLFGTREYVEDISLSPDGSKVAFLSPDAHHGSVAIVMDVATGAMTGALRTDGDKFNLSNCGWSLNVRLVCQMAGVSAKIPFSRTIAVDPDGKNIVYLGRKVGSDALRPNQFDGEVIDWMGGDGTILMTRDYVPEDQQSSVFSADKDGLGVDRIDTVTGKANPLEPPSKQATDYYADGQGNVRMIRTAEKDDDGELTGVTSYLYRKSGTRAFTLFSRTKNGAGGLVPIAVDGTRNTAYAVKTLDGRDALYSVALDGSMKAELVSSSPDVDVHSIVTIGRRGRVIGAVYVTDKRQVDYFDPEYKKLAAALGRALPQLPLIHFVGASADEKKLLIYASSDVDPGRYYLFNKDNHHLDELLEARPDMADTTLAPMTSITFKSADGTSIPAYLTLPPGGAAKNLPAIVMPHGGPDYRDEWGFDWLVQYFAQRGYAVIQPEFRGSSGYGDAFYAKNGFHSWQTAIGDVLDAGHYLVKAGIADPSKLAIVGWSYGGYAALQANVVDPTLFKAVVAVAPVTDLGMVKSEAEEFTNARLVAQQVGSGEIVTKGSPDRHADRFQAPVLMFHGDRDMNVGVGESKAMDSALRHAGKQSTLVVYPGLDHQLDDSEVRAKMLDQADGFLRTSMKL